ncbi:uncharacterized protein RCH25_007130 [Pelodytes ibericus]
MDVSPKPVRITTSPALITVTEKECFICREGDQDDLQHFCDCTDLIGHHQCLLTWIQKGSGNEDRQKCSACTAKYLLQKGSVWRTLLCQWKNLLLVALLMVALIMVPVFVYEMRTLSDPPPHGIFKAAAICSGAIAETLLIRYIIWYCTNQYSNAIISSYSIKAREEKPSEGVGSPWPADQTLTAVVNLPELEKQNGGLQSDTFGLKLPV